MASIALKLGEELDIARRIQRIEFSEAIDRLDSLVAELVITKHDDPATLMTALKPGIAFTVELLDDEGTAVETFPGDVVEVEHVRRPRGGHRVTVVGLDGLHRLQGSQPAQLWEASHDAIVSEIAGRHSLTAVADGVDTTEGFELQGDIGDARFLHKLAREHNYIVRVVNGELLFKRRAVGEAVTLTWGEDIVEIRQRASIDGLFTKVIVRGYDDAQDAAIDVMADSGALAGISGGTTGVAVYDTAFGARELILNQAGYIASTNAEERAKAELLARAGSFIQGSVLTKGNPAALSGKKLTIADAGWPLSGDFLIHQTRHVLDIAYGYRTWIDFTSDSYPAES